VLTAHSCFHSANLVVLYVLLSIHFILYILKGGIVVLR